MKIMGVNKSAINMTRRPELKPINGTNIKDIQSRLTLENKGKPNKRALDRHNEFQLKEELDITPGTCNSSDISASASASPNAMFDAKDKQIDDDTDVLKNNRINEVVTSLLKIVESQHEKSKYIGHIDYMSKSQSASTLTKSVTDILGKAKQEDGSGISMGSPPTKPITSSIASKKQTPKPVASVSSNHTKGSSSPCLSSRRERSALTDSSLKTLSCTQSFNDDIPASSSSQPPPFKKKKRCGPLACLDEPSIHDTLNLYLLPTETRLAASAALDLCAIRTSLTGTRRKRQAAVPFQPKETPRSVPRPSKGQSSSKLCDSKLKPVDQQQKSANRIVHRPIAIPVASNLYPTVDRKRPGSVITPSHQEDSEVCISSRLYHPTAGSMPTRPFYPTSPSKLRHKGSAESHFSSSQPIGPKRFGVETEAGSRVAGDSVPTDEASTVAAEEEPKIGWDVEGIFVTTDKPYHVPDFMSSDHDMVHSGKQALIEIPKWRVVTPVDVRPSSSTRSVHHGPVDDESTSDDVFSARHSRWETEEIRREKWERQRLREMALKERWESKQLRLQAKLRLLTLGVSMAREGTAEESNPPSLPNTLAGSTEKVEVPICVKDRISVIAFASPVTKMEPIEFSLPWVGECDVKPTIQSLTSSSRTKSKTRGQKKGRL